MKHLRVLLLVLICFALFSQVFAQANKPLALVMTANGPIEPAMLEYFKRGIETAAQRQAEVLIIQLNTPGGDIQSMLEIVTAIRSSKVPVVIYIAPRGAWAASAGALITMAGQASAMAPETTIGAAIPINSSGQNLNSDLRTKQMNILKDTIHPFVAPRGKAALQLAEAMLTDGKSADATKALDAKLVDFPASDIKDLLNKLNGFTIQLSTGTRTLHTANANTEPLDMSFIERFLLFLTDSNIAFLLLAIGVQSIIIEISHPGGWIAGFIGIVCLSLLVYSFGILPINWFGIIFLVTAFVLFILDIKAPTHGALTAAGVASFIIGALMLFNSPGTPQFQRVSVPLVVGVGIFFGLMFFGILLFALRTMRNPVMTGVGTMLGKTGTAKTWDEASGQVQMQSELWSAESVQESDKISKGDEVEVVEVQGLRLKVRKK